MEKYPHPTPEQWRKIQGSQPYAWEEEESGIIVVFHPNTGMIVPTDKDAFKKMGTVRILVDGEIIEAAVAYFSALHGTPCEERSSRIGGEGYNRLNGKG